MTIYSTAPTNSDINTPDMNSFDKFKKSAFGFDEVQAYFSKLISGNKKEDKKDDDISLEENTKNIEAEKYEYQRAFNDNNYLYQLGLDAKSGNCNAIKKILNYSCVIFDTVCQAAIKLINETVGMLKDLVSEYSNGTGMLSDKAEKAAYKEVENDKRCVNKAQIEQKAHEKMDDMLVGI